MLNLLLISEYVTDSYGNHLFKAPKGKQFHVKSINHASVSVPGGNTVYMYDREVSSIGNHESPVWIGQGSTNSNGSAIVDFKTKYISISENAASGLEMWIQVYGDLVDISYIDAIWEFLTKKIHR